MLDKLCDNVLSIFSFRLTEDAGKYPKRFKKLLTLGLLWFNKVPSFVSQDKRIIFYINKRNDRRHIQSKRSNSFRTIKTFRQF